MYDLERIDSIISDIDNYAEKIESFNIKTIKDMDDDKNFYSCSMLIFNIVNRSLDLAEQIVRDKSLGTPLEYKEFFIILERAKFITSATSEKMRDLVIKRNKISHRYGNITKKEIFGLIEEIKIYKKFTKEILEKMKNEGR